MKGVYLSLLTACVLLGAVTAHETPEARGSWDELTVLRPGRVYTASVAEPSLYAVRVKEGDAVAVQIERTSYRRVVAGEPLPRVRVCDARGCAHESREGRLALAYTALQARAFSHPTRAGRQLTFSLERTTPGTSAVVAVLVCVGPDAALASCRAACTLNCSHGAPSTLLNACVCDTGYTGTACRQTTTNYTRRSLHSEFDSDFELVMAVVAFVVWAISAVLFVAFVLALAAVLCGLLRACCARSSVRRGRVLRSNNTNQNNNTPSVRAAPAARATTTTAPPPPYPGVAYHPINVVPPPPPPAPLPVPQNAVEMARFPAPSAVYIIPPPPAPVRDVPVYPQRPVPRN